MMEPWLAGFLISFFELMIAILILHKARKRGWLGMLILLLAFLFWGFAFDFYPLHEVPSDLSPFQNPAGRMGCFFGAASTCIWLDAPKGKKACALLCVENWGKFTGLTAIFLIGMTETALIFSDAFLFIFWMIGILGPSCDRKEDADHDFILGLIICIAAMGISALWIWQNWESGGYAAAMDELDMTAYMICMLFNTSLFYGRGNITSDIAKTAKI